MTDEKLNVDAAEAQREADGAQAVADLEADKVGDQALDVDLDGAREMEFVGATEAELTGLFNTFRIGAKWRDLERLEALALVMVDEDGGRATLDGPGIVLHVDHGDLVDMLDKHVGLNHGVADMRQAVDQRRDLRAILEDAYGRRLRDNEKCVVVYVARVI